MSKAKIFPELGQNELKVTKNAEKTLMLGRTMPTVATEQSRADTPDISSTMEARAFTRSITSIWETVPN